MKKIKSTFANAMQGFLHWLEIYVDPRIISGFLMMTVVFALSYARVTFWQIPALSIVAVSRFKIRAGKLLDPLVPVMKKDEEQGLRVTIGASLLFFWIAGLCLFLYLYATGSISVVGFVNALVVGIFLLFFGIVYALYPDKSQRSKIRFGISIALCLSVYVFVLYSLGVAWYWILAWPVLFWFFMKKSSQAMRRLGLED